MKRKKKVLDVILKGEISIENYESLLEKLLVEISSNQLKNILRRLTPKRLEEIHRLVANRLYERIRQ